MSESVVFVSVFINLNYGHISLCLLMKQSRWRTVATNEEKRELCFERGAGPLMKSFSFGLDYLYYRWRDATTCDTGLHDRKSK